MNPLLLALCVGLAGSAGSVLRVWLDTVFASPVPCDGRQPRPRRTGTLAANVLGSLMMGLSAGAVAASGLPDGVRTIAIVGFCGGLTTFSTFSVATVRLWDAGERRMALGNIGANVLLGVPAAGLGFWIGALPF